MKEPHNSLIFVNKTQFDADMAKLNALMVAAYWFRYPTCFGVVNWVSNPDGPRNAQGQAMESCAGAPYNLTPANNAEYAQYEESMRAHVVNAQHYLNEIAGGSLTRNRLTQAMVDSDPCEDHQCVMAKPLNPIVPGAIVCRDHDTVLLMIEIYKNSVSDNLRASFIGSEKNKLLHGAPSQPPNLKQFGCVLLPAGTPMKWDGNWVPAVVTIKLQNDKIMRGVTDPSMIDNRPPPITAPTLHTVMPQKPNRVLALQELFGVSGSSAKAKLSTNRLASIWFDQTFRNGGDEIYVVFVKEQELDEEGQLNTCHACSVTIDAVTYKTVSGGWVTVSKQKNIAKIGSYGDAPKISRAEVLQLSPGNTTLLINSEYTGQGETYSYKEILENRQNEWRHLGDVLVSADNLGSACADSPADQQAKSGNSCWSFIGKVSVQPSNDMKYPNIVIDRSGTGYERTTGKVVAVERVIYVFDGKKYVASKRKL